MATIKKLNYTQEELDWYEERIADIKDFINKNSPLSSITSETVVETNAKGVPIVKVIAKASETIKLIMSMMKDMPGMIRDLEELRTAKAAGKIETRGGKKVPGAMEDFLKARELT